MGIALQLLFTGLGVGSIYALVALGMTAFAFVRYVSQGSAFTSPEDRFRQFWAERESSLTGRENQESWRDQAGELTKLYASAHPENVLEIGCGDGSLFPFFGIPAANYKGVDFTAKFVERFRSHQPAVQLECAEGASYLDQGKQYDLILLNGIVQHFDRDMLEQHLENARIMLRDGGLLIWGSIPQRRHRRQYDAGKWSGKGKASAARLIRSWGGRLLGLDAMGYWYEPEEIAALAKKHHLRADFVASTHCPYRFHSVLRKPAASGNGHRQKSSGSESKRKIEEDVNAEFCKLPTH